jgi:hypothetical protein
MFFHYHRFSVFSMITNHHFSKFQFLFFFEDNHDVPVDDPSDSESEIECDIDVFDDFPISVAITFRALAAGWKLASWKIWIWSDQWCQCSHGGII